MVTGLLIWTIVTKFYGWNIAMIFQIKLFIRFMPAVLIAHQCLLYYSTSYINTTLLSQ